MRNEDDDYAEESSVEYPMESGKSKGKVSNGRRIFILGALLLLVAAICLSVLTVESKGQDPGSPSNSSAGNVAPENSTATSPVNPVNASSTAPPCVDQISVDKLCYEYGENITVTFKVCDPTSFDWVGLYRLPDDTGDDEVVGGDENLFSDQLRFRVWTCGLPEDEPGCDDAPSEGTLGIDAFVRPGSFLMYLGKGEDPTLASEHLVASETFTSTEEGCSE